MDMVVDLGPAVALGTAVSPLAKLTVDIIRRADTAGSLPGWLLPLVAALAGLVYAALAVWAGGVLTVQTIPLVLLAGPVAAGWALGITEGQRWADRQGG